MVGNSDKAIEYFEKSLEISREVKDRDGEGQSLGALGVVYNDLGNYIKAIEYHEQNLVIARELNKRIGELDALGNLGTSYYYLGNYSKSIEYTEKSLAITRELRNVSGEATLLGNLGDIYNSLGNYTKAIDYQERSLLITREIKDRYGEGRVLDNLGESYQSLGNYTKAIDYHEKSLTISREIKDRQTEGAALQNLGNAYNALGKYYQAIEYHEKSLMISREIKDRKNEGAILGNIGLAYTSLGNYDKAINYYEENLKIAREIGNRRGEQRSFNNIAVVLSRKDNFGLATIFYKKSVNTSEGIRQGIRKLPRETQEIYTSSVASTYRALANILLTQGRIREAQSILELLKVQELQGYGKNQEIAASPIELPLHPLESQALQAFEKIIASKSLTLESLQTIAQPLTQNRDRITQDMNAMPIAIGNPQAVLKANPNALLIQNLVVGDKLWVLRTNASGNTKAISLKVTQKELTTTVETFRKQIGSPYSNLKELKATSQKLHNWLIPPELQAELKNNPKPQLLFSLDHVTRYIPVAALYDGNQYLAQRYTLSNLITMDSDMGDRLSPEGESPTILALGTSNAIPGFNPLPNVEAELNAIVKDSNPQGIYPGKIRLNQAFTAKSLTENLDQFRVLHIATHGSFNPKSITASFLLLGNGDRLPITDIASLTSLTNTHLVVLSACETGISGNAQDGTEISGISGYFLRRGAKSVLASLWSVNDASTSLLMQQFYRHTAAGMTKAQALQTAQQDFLSGKLTAKDAPQRANLIAVPVSGNRPLNSSTTFAHPYYWAPFFLTGNSL